MIKEIRESRLDFFNGIFLGTGIGVLMQLAGYLLVKGAGSELGWVLFICVPFVSGYAVAVVVRKPGRIAACAATGMLITGSFLLFSGWEGIVCLLMSIPLIAFGIFAGAVTGYQLRGRFKDPVDPPKRATFLMLLACPLFLAAANKIEQPFRQLRSEEIFTSKDQTEAIRIGLGRPREIEPKSCQFKMLTNVQVA